MMVEIKYSPEFLSFWKGYPKKLARLMAGRAWKKINPDDGLIKTIMESLEKHKRTEQWRKDGGAYIPYPATWLNQRRWEDELKVEISKPVAAVYKPLEITAIPPEQEYRGNAIEDFERERSKFLMANKNKHLGD
jgi:hypothetical protein